MATPAAGGYGRIAILGGGAIGQLYAGLLARAAPERVTLITRRAEARDRLGQRLVIKQPQQEPLTIEGLDARLPDEATEGYYDVALIAVSAYDTAAIAPLVARILRPDGLCITVQNGINNEAALAGGAGGRSVLVGATSFVVHLEDVASVSLDGRGVTWLPALPAAFNWIHEWFGAAGLNPKSVDNPQELLWRKTAIATNGYVSLILGFPIGRVVRSASGREIAKRAALEIVSVAQAQGVRLRDDDIVATLEAAWASCSEDARSSLYSDYLAGRRTELDERLGSVLDRAAGSAVPVPTLQALYLLSKARLEVEKKPA